MRDYQRETMLHVPGVPWIYVRFGNLLPEKVRFFGVLVRLPLVLLVSYSYSSGDLLVRQKTCSILWRHFELYRLFSVELLASTLACIKVVKSGFAPHKTSGSGYFEALCKHFVGLYCHSEMYTTLFF